MRLHVEMEDKFTSWKGAQQRDRDRGGSAAADLFHPSMK